MSQLGISCIFIQLGYRDKLSKFQSESSLPLIGHSHHLGKTSEELIPSLEKMWIKFGRDKFLLKLGIRDHVVITKPKDIEALLITLRLLEKNVIYRHIADLVGDGLLTVESGKWHSQRKMLTPAFYSHVVESYEAIYKEEADSLIEDLEKTQDKDVNFLNVLFQKVLVTIIKAGVGLDINLGSDTEYLDILTKLVAITNEKIFSLWKSISFIYNLSPEGKMFRRNLNWIIEKNLTVLRDKREKLKDLIEDVNAGKRSLESITEDEDLQKKRMGFIDLLLLARKSNGEYLSDEDIIVEVLTFTLAGIETTSAALAFALYNLATNPDIQEKVLDEQRQITNNDLQKSVTIDEVKGMKYLHAVVKETMRLNNPVVFYGRQTTEDVTLPDGLILPAGVNILFFPYFSHRHPGVFPNPEKFDPERFINNIPLPFTYIPFSVGVRDCIGKKFAMVQIKFYLASLVRYFEFLPPLGPGPKATVELGLKSATGVLVRYRKRQHYGNTCF